ncbi:hypothetical protein DUF881 [Gottschalkia acidurici 9a]|uniref:Division initiation protein n=1 Tax=Gottschalkia acidurici (strain ATCC 7906 / DSM 604 / BCRC 14475 / CIP 104303 / KCTC 5404 / NCIMB 10678 / 9a) TaxID=1128398 RepID=K0AV77_GOTA9|nr:DUF881 domain-containing protein [Gottschalkia acidurici]AFS77763.1 hypothetical protein DUF881 [Gottschalkia acidurici 9a]
MIGIKDKIVFILICIVLGVILSIQFKTVVSTVGEGVNPNQRGKQLSLEYEKLQDQKEELKSKLDDVEKEIKKHVDIEKDKDAHVEKLYSELEKYKMFVGYSTIKGPGISIEINEPSMQMKMGEESSILIANYDLILQLISRLNDLGAEAISINDQRYTNYTSLQPDVNRIKINGISVSPPFIINVIGNAEELQRGLKVKGNVMWDMEHRYLYGVKIKESGNIIIPKYTKIEKLKYAKPSKGNN